MNTTELSIILPALLAGILVLASHVPLGIEVLKRGIIFIDLAIAQVAGLGALAATLFFDEHGSYHIWLVQACSLSAALLGALALTWTEKKFPEIQEALIGCLFVLAASLALLLLGQNPHGSEHMKDLLAGQILFVSTNQLITVAVIYTALLALWFGARKHIKGFGFYTLFAVTVTCSVQLVGVYLVFASLILPALASRNFDGRKKLLAAYSFGAAGLLTGLFASMWWDMTTGPAIVCGMFMVGLPFIIRRKPNL